ncbi:nephrin-like isoform X2 [Liolophura sinensis]|uniref:nephrin-like isoform X2 n=1 Tax=Liolophura sinensis TaxID=3198878 RepID=UPI0031588635
MKDLFTALLSLWQILSVFSQSIKAPGDVVAGRPFTLECKITRPTGDLLPLIWYHDADNVISRIYATPKCSPSIQLSLVGLFGGCQNVSGGEVYTVTIENVTENTARGRWGCQYGSRENNVTLDIKVMVTQVTLTNSSDVVLAGDPTTLTCVSSASKPQACIRAYIRSSGSVRELDPHDCNQDSNSVQTTNRTLRFTARAEENGAALYCNASNSVTDPPVQSRVKTLNVQFGPGDVHLRIDSGQSENTVTVTEKSTVTFTCNTSESNPAAVLSWYNNSSPIVAAKLSKVSSQRGSNYGYLTTQRYTVRVDGYQDGDVIRYSPRILCNSTQVTLFEGQRLKMSCDVTSNDDVVIHWYKSGRRIDNAVTTNSRGPARRDVTMSTVEYESAEARLSGVYQIEANNSIGSSTRQIKISVIEGQFIPKELRLISCTENQTSLVWASGIEDSLVEYYKLEYKGREKGWEGGLVRNPGRIKLVETNVNNLQAGVFYQFRLQPNSGIALSEYATTNCTIQASRPIRGQNNVPEAGVSKGGILAIGVVIGIAVVTIIYLSVSCWRRRKPHSRANKEHGFDQENTEQVMRVVEDRTLEDRGVADTAGFEQFPHGQYEDLDTRPSSGPHYEGLTGTTSPSTSRENRVYENATVF